MKNNFFYPLKAIFVGLVVSQALATLHVYLSNIELYKITAAINKAGYLAIPNEQVASSLPEIGPAFLGGLFFTFTVGVCLAALSFFGAWIWDRILFRKKPFLIIFFVIWLAGLWATNSRGLCLMAAAYFLFIPPAVFIVSLKYIPGPFEQKPKLTIIVHAICFTVLTLIGLTQIRADTFLSIRDNLLLSTPAGRKVNDFYYKYGLYAAQALKSQGQRILKTCDLSLIDDKPLAGRIEKVLISHDYLPVDKESPIDLKILKTKKGLALINNGRPFLQTTADKFFHNPEELLKKFSEKSDRRIFFRGFTFFSILFLSLAALYFCLYFPLRLITGFLLSSTLSSIAAAILCCITGTILLFVLYFETGRQIDTKELTEALESGSRNHRVAALKVAVQKRIEIADFPARSRILTSPYIPERYWLAQALSVSRSPETYQELLQLLDDSHFNVVCMAFDALGQRDDHKDKPEIIYEIVKRIKTFDNWYCQIYAYRTLRKLGWKQAKSQ